MSYFSRIQKLYHIHIGGHEKEARFLVLMFFTLTFIIARLTVYSIKYHLLPAWLVGYIFIRDIHIHHLVFGILLLLIAGIIRIPQDDDELIRFSSALYGIGAALTLDEFALWLRLNPEAYFGSQGRISLDAVVLFTLILLSSIWYGNFWTMLFNHTFLYTYNFFKYRKWLRLFKGKKQYQKIIIVVIMIATAYYAGFLGTFYITSSISHSQLKPHSHHMIAIKEVQKLPSALCLPTDTSISRSISSTKVLTAAQIQASAQKANAAYCLNVPTLFWHHIMPQAESVAKKQTSLSVDTGIFDQQMAYLVAHGYQTISIDRLVDALRKHVGLPSKSIVLTFDDAYLDNYTNMFPIIKKYHLIANIAVPTGLLGVSAGNNKYFTWDQLHEMVNSGLVYMVNHSWSHASMRSSSMDKDQFEISTAQHQLQQALGKTPETFVYPYGETKSQVYPLLQANGIAAAFTTTGGFSQCDNSLYTLHRNRVGNFQLSTLGLY